VILGYAPLEGTSGIIAIDEDQVRSSRRPTWRREENGMSSAITRSTVALAALAACAVLAAPAMAAEGGGEPRVTPLLMTVEDPPVPFRGSDGRIHLVYELALTNFSSDTTRIRAVQVRTPGGRVLQTLRPKALGGPRGRLQPAGRRDGSASMAASTESLLFVHLRQARGANVPRTLEHRVTAAFDAAGGAVLAETGGRVSVNRRRVVRFGPPLRGSGYLSADSCCDASRHTRAALPVDGRVWLAQRYAVDWEQLDAQGRIYHGPKLGLNSYAIYGDPIYAVADGVVSSTIEGLPDQIPGTFPEKPALREVDGNSVVLNVGGGNYVLFAHMQPGSVRVNAGQRVRRGDVLGLVGNSGNSVAPHLHLHVTAGPSAIGSNGLPYAIDSYALTGATAGTEAFDEAEANGTVLPVTPFSPPRQVRNALPLDQLVVDFP
jgi:hypothetical protein